MFKLKVEQQDDGSFAAYDDNRYEGDVDDLSIGRGGTEQEALEDLADALDGGPEGAKLIRDVLALMRKGSLAVVTTKDDTWKCTRCGKRLDEIGLCQRGPCPMAKVAA